MTEIPKLDICKIFEAEIAEMKEPITEKSENLEISEEPKFDEPKFDEPEPENFENNVLDMFKIWNFEEEEDEHSGPSAT